MHIDTSITSTITLAYLENKLRLIKKIKNFFMNVLLKIPANPEVSRKGIPFYAPQ